MKCVKCDHEMKITGRDWFCPNCGHQEILRAAKHSVSQVMGGGFLLLIGISFLLWASSLFGIEGEPTLLFGSAMSTGAVLALWPLLGGVFFFLIGLYVLVIPRKVVSDMKDEKQEYYNRNCPSCGTTRYRLTLKGSQCPICSYENVK